MDSPISIILVDDHMLFRMGLRSAFERATTRIKIVGEASSSDELFALLPNVRADLILLDIVLPDVSGIEIARRLRRERPEMKILMLSAESDRQTIMQLMEVGIDGFVSKGVDVDELQRAVEYVACGAEYFGRDIARIIHCLKVARKNIDETVFTPREAEIISLCVKGFQAKEIADTLGVSIGTVNTHKNNIYKKLGINNSIELVSYALKNGIIKI